MTKVLHGLSYEDYAAIPGMRSSHLMALKRSPAHYQALLAKPKEETDALAFGKLFHSAMENPERFMDVFKVEPAFIGLTKDGRESAQSGEAKAKRKEWWDSLPKDAIVVPQRWADDLAGMVRSVQAHKILGQMVKGGMRETSLVSVDPETGEPVKARPDLIATKGYVLDYKTTRDARPDFFLRQVFSDRSNSPFYALAASHYAHLARLAGVGRGDSLVIAAVEKERPWGVMVYPLDRGQLEVGESHRAPLMRRLVNCKRSNLWPCYEERAYPTAIPNWVEWPTEYSEEEP